jgi:hypothetical protein
MHMTARYGAEDQQTEPSLHTVVEQVLPRQKTNKHVDTALPFDKSPQHFLAEGTGAPGPVKMKRDLRKPLLFVTFACLLLATVSVALAQPRSGLGGRWNWQENPRKNREQVGMFLHVEQTGSRVRGTYTYGVWMNGQPQSEDGNQTPFVGTVKGDVAVIKFDPENIHPLYERNVKYKEPANGKAPSTARLQRIGQTLEWTLTAGPRLFHLPVQFTLRRVK